MCKSTFDEEDQGEEPREEKCPEPKKKDNLLESRINSVLA